MYKSFFSFYKILQLIYCFIIKIIILIIPLTKKNKITLICNEKVILFLKFNVYYIGSPEPPLPPPRNHDPNVSGTSNEANDSKDSNQISEAECDQHKDSPPQDFGGKFEL